MEEFMGGNGSGSWFRHGSKQAIDLMLRIDICYLKNRHMLETGRYNLTWCSGHDGEPIGSATINVLSGKGMVVSYMLENDSNGNMEEVNKVVRLTQTACTFGGQRQWFLCPYCYRRVGVVVLCSSMVACRHCLNLTYSSQNENLSYRALRKRDKIGDRIGINSPFDVYDVTKPKGMHWKTFHRLRNDYEQADKLSEISFYGQFS
jgi:hypothetical protein